MNESENIRFTTFLREKAAEAKRDLGYNPTDFLKMLAADGGYATVSRLIADKKPSTGFVKLWEHRRLDLSVEALLLETEQRIPVLSRDPHPLANKVDLSWLISRVVYVVRANEDLPTSFPEVRRHSRVKRVTAIFDYLNERILICPSAWLCGQGALLCWF